MSAQSYYNRGVEKFNKGQYQSALDDFNTCVKLQKNATYYYYRGATLGMLKKYDLALNDIFQCIDLRKGQLLPWDLYWLGVCLFHVDRFEEALKAMNTCIALRGGNSIAWDYYYRGAINSRLENHEVALGDISTCIKLRNGKQESWDYYWLAVCNYFLGKHQTALESIDTCIKLRNGIQEAWDYYYRGACNSNLGHHSAAMTDINLCIKLRNGKTTPWDHYLHGRCAYELGDYLTAKSDFTVALDLPNSSDYHAHDISCFYWIGMTYKQLNQPQEAVNNFQKSVCLNPISFYQCFFHGRAGFELKFYDFALKSLNKAVKLHPVSDYYFWRAKILFELGKDEDTINDCWKAIGIEDKQEYKELLNSALKRQQQDQDHVVKPTVNPSPKGINYNISFMIPYTELKMIKELGRGAFGVVFKGTWKFNDVAVKQLLVDKPSRDALEEFQTECMIMTKLRSPNIVQLYGICNEDGRYCIVMEFMDKGSLYNVLHDSIQTLTWNIREQMAIDIIKGIYFLHSNNILHRDIKSLNVLLDKNNNAKISDFGLSKMKTEISNTTKSSSAVGTLPWMAPELFENEQYTQKCDIYSYGMLLWELASRKTPYTDCGNQVAILKRVCDGKRETIPYDTPSKIAKMIALCWHQNPNNRPSAEEVIKDFVK